MASIFANNGLCCQSPEQCAITGCDIDETKCCRLNDDYICDNNTPTNIYEGSFTIAIPMDNNSNNNVYFRLYSDYIYFEYTLPSPNNNAIGISWSDYNHPLPDFHFTIFASDTNADNKWKMFDMTAQKNNYTLNGSTTKYDCQSQTGYCLSNRQLDFNYQPYYNLFHFTQQINANETTFVWERKYSVNQGLYQFDGLYESINNNNNQICFNYAIFDGNTIGNGGEKINEMDHICTKVHNICDDITDKMCATNKVDLVIILDITLSDNVWHQLQKWIQALIIDIDNKLHGNINIDILFRVSLITFCDANCSFDILQSLYVYNWGNQMVLKHNLLYDINDIIIKNPNRTTTAHLKGALSVATMVIFPENKPNDMLFTLVITDEVAENEESPCSDMETVNEFNSYNPIFGAVFIDEFGDDTLLPLFEQSIHCLINNYSQNYSVIQTNSSVNPSSSFHSFYDFIDDIDINNLNVNQNACDSLINITWPQVDEYLPMDQCVTSDMDLVFVIDLTAKNNNTQCFNCWIDTISSVIMSTFNLVQDSIIPFVSSSLHIAIVTFDGNNINTYYNLNDEPINDYPQLSQILSLLQSLEPTSNSNENSHSLLDAAMRHIKENVYPYKSMHGALQTLIFIDEMYVINQNMSYQDICTATDDIYESYLIHDYQSLIYNNLYPLYDIKCINGTFDELHQQDTGLVITAAYETDILIKQLNIEITHKYCPQQCYDCDLPLYDETKNLHTTVFKANWVVNKPMTAGWNLTTSELSFQEIIQSIQVYIYGLKTYNHIQISVYDYAADKYIAKSNKYNGEIANNRYDVQLPVRNKNGEYNYLLPNHEYHINIQLYNVSKKDVKNIEIALQNVSDNIYYQPQASQHFASINGLLFVYYDFSPFNVAYNAVSQYTPFGNICVVCVGEDDMIPLPPTTQIPSQTQTVSPTDFPTAIPSSDPTTEPTDIPSQIPTNPPTVKPTNIPSLIPSNQPTNEPTYIPSTTPTNEPTIIGATNHPSQIPTNEPTYIPSKTPTNQPTIEPTNIPSQPPSNTPTMEPTNNPSEIPTVEPTYIPSHTPSYTPTTEPTNNPSTSPTAEPTGNPTHFPSKKPTHSPTNGPSHIPSESPTITPSENPSQTPSKAPTSTATLRPSLDTKCPDREPDSLCTITCNENIGNETEWEVQFTSYDYNTLTDVTTFNYQASVSALPPPTDEWCRSNNKNTQAMTIIFLYISTCCETLIHPEKLRNITSTGHDNNNEISLWGINGNHWIFYPFKLSRGSTSEFSLQLSGEYITTQGSYVASQKSWFDGSRPNYRCALHDIFVPDICGFESKSPTNQPTIEPTNNMTSITTTVAAMTTSTPTTSTSFSSTRVMTTSTDDGCPDLGWPDLESDCEQYCVDTEHVEWKMAHMSTLYNSLSATTTLAWSVTVEADSWSVDDWCFPQSFAGHWNFPERLKRVLIRFNKCCANVVELAPFMQIIEGVSDDGEFEIISNDDGTVNGIQWDNIDLRKGKTGMFFVTFKGNMTLINGDYWFFGGNRHARCSSNKVQVPDICHAMQINDYDINTNLETDWYLQWVFLIEAGGTRRRMRQENDLFIAKQWIEDNNAFICNDWIKIIDINRDYIKFCNVSIVKGYEGKDEKLNEFAFEVDIIVDQHKINNSKVVKLKSEFEFETNEKIEAQNAMSSDIISISGANDINLKCNNFVIKEIAEFNTYTAADEKISYSMFNNGSVILGFIAILVCFCILIYHKYYKNKTKMIDGTYPKNEASLIHQIEELFMKQLYENNEKNSQHRQLNAKLHQHPRIFFVEQKEESEDESVDNILSLSPIIEEQNEIIDNKMEDEDDDGSSISNLSSNDDDDNVSLHIGWNGEYSVKL